MLPDNLPLSMFKVAMYKQGIILKYVIYFTIGQCEI